MEDFLLGIISRSIIALHLWWIKCLCRYVTAVLHICWAGRSLFISWHILTLLTLNVGLLPYLININIGIYPVLNDVSFFFFGNISGMFVYLFWIPPISLYVCQCVIWHTFFLKLCQYRVLDDISICNLLDTFSRYFQTISEVFLIYCMTVGLWVNLLPCWNKANIGISWVLDELSFWISWRLAWNVCTPNQNNSEFLVCLSVC